jgi:PKD domain
VSLRSLIPALTLLCLALAPASAHAAAYEIRFEPPNPLVGQEIKLHAERTNPGQGEAGTFVWSFGDGTPDQTSDAATEVSHTYAAAGSYTVTLRRAESDPSTPAEDTAEVVVTEPNRAPSAGFAFEPQDPLAGDAVVFDSTASDPDGDELQLTWDFGDGATASGTEERVTHRYATPGTYEVTLTAMDSHGAADERTRTVTVRARPNFDSDGGNDGGGTGTPISPGTPGAPTLVQRRTGLVAMRPFPRVRIAGVILQRGARVRILSVRGPRGARVQVRCRGRGCPVRSVGRMMATRLLRLRAFERTLRAGTTLELFVRKPGRIGKYTRIVIRAGRAPKRVDRCLVPGRPRPLKCA